MRKILFKISAYILAAAVFAGGGAWIGASFAGSANTGVLPESAGGTGRTDIINYIGTLRPVINGSSVTSSTSIWAPTSYGTAGNGLISNGTNNAPYWGSVSQFTTSGVLNTTAYPIGTTLFSYVHQNGTVPNRNASVNVYTSSGSTEFSIGVNNSGTILSGTWVARGCVNHANGSWNYSCLVQRIA